MASSSFSERLANIFRERDITQQEAAQKVGVSRQAIARWLNGSSENGSSEPERAKIVALAEFLRLPPAYLMFGESGAFDSVELNDNMISIPVLDVQGGCWPAGRENTVVSMVMLLKVMKDWVLSRCPNANLFKLHIINAFGDSMEPTIKEGDFIIVDTSKTNVAADGIYAIQAGQETFIKRIQRQIDGSVLLLSDNPHYQPYKVPPEDRETMKIIGKCIINCKADEL